MSPATFGFVPLASELCSVKEAEGLLESFRSDLEALGGRVLGPDEVDRELPLFVLVLTGGTESRAVELLERRHRALGPTPAWLLAHPNHNSLPAALETLAHIQQEGGQGRVIYLDGTGDGAALGDIGAVVEHHRVRRALEATRIGLLGGPSSWLVASSPSAATVQEAWGPEVVDIPLSDLYQAMDEVDGAAVEERVTAWRQGAAEVREPDAQDLRRAARVAIALPALLDQMSVSAVTLRCFDLIGDRGTTACLALSELADQGRVAGCEGDLPSLIAMVWARELLGDAGWMANPAQIHRAKNALLLAHCTAPKSGAESYVLRSHFESGSAVAVASDFEPGPATLLRIGGHRLDALWLAEGEVIDWPRREELCRTQAMVQLSARCLDELLARPLGNHLVLLRGHHRGTLSAYFEETIRR